MAKTDITDCYGSVYTHSLAWAINGKKAAKANSKKPHKDKADLLGDRVDGLLRDMSNGQTNGIPQGSVLMDFVAKIVLGSEVDVSDYEDSTQFVESLLASFNKDTKS